MDLNETFLAEAASKAQMRGLDARWERHDMRDLPFDSEFDAAINFGGSFGFFDWPDDARTAAEVYRSLRPGGRFLVDIATPETLFPRFGERFWFPAGELLVLSEKNRYVPESARIETDWTVVAPDGTREHRHSSMRLYTYRELSALLSDAGFTHVEGFDADDLTPFRLGASRLMAVATK